MQATTLPQVLDLQQRIIDQAIAQQSPRGYFAALYQMFTLKVAQGIEQGVFEDGARMQRLAVCFANYYFRALEAWRSGGHLPEAWRFAFDTCERRIPVVFQHLVLALNPHIGYDLPAAVSEIAPGGAIGSIKADFNRINGLLANSVDTVKQDLTDIWPPLKLTNRFAWIESKIVDFSFEQGRGIAWRSATELAPLAGAARAAKLEAIDRRLRELAAPMRHPGWGVVLVAMIRLGERGTVADRIRDLQAAGTRLPHAESLLAGPKVK